MGDRLTESNESYIRNPLKISDHNFRQQSNFCFWAFQGEKVVLYTECLNKNKKFNFADVHKCKQYACASSPLRRQVA